MLYSLNIQVHNTHYYQVLLSSPTLNPCSALRNATGLLTIGKYLLKANQLTVIHLIICISHISLREIRSLQHRCTLYLLLIDLLSSLGAHKQQVVPLLFWDG